MGDAILVGISVALLILCVWWLYHVQGNRSACYERGGIYLENQCVKGELLE